MHIAKKCDIGERLISLLVVRCGSCQLEAAEVKMREERRGCVVTGTFK